MVSIRWIVLIQVVVLLFVSSPAWSEAKMDKKITKRFKVDWSSIQYSKTSNIRKDSPTNQDTSERLSISCEIEILKPDLVLGTTQQAVITRLTDSNDQNIVVAQYKPAQRGSMHMRYEGLRYDRKYVRPPQPNRWLARIQSALKIPKRPRPQPEWVNELQPSRMQVGLDAGLCEPAGGEIGRIEGYFYALMAESLEYVEVPFEPNGNWVRLTDDVEIQVREARQTNNSFHFDIKTGPRRGASMRPLTATDLVPNRIVVDRQFIKADGKPTRHFIGFRRLPTHVSGSGSASGGDIGPIKKIRFVIAVNPTHYKVPFEFEHIPLPKP